MKNIKTANRMETVHSDIRGPLFVEAMEMRKRGIDVLRLNTGNPAAFGFKTPDSIIRALRENEETNLGYCDFKGMPSSREAISEYHRKNGIQGVSADDVFIGNGLSEVVSFALMALLDDGDEVLLPSPSYSLWGNCVILAGGKPVFYVCDESNGWNPDIDDIRSKVTDRTRAIVIINPNNPTGAVYTKETLLAIADIARERELLLFADEIYDRLLLDGAKHISVASLAPDIPVCTLNGLSKSHFLCGYRCGWMIISGPSEVTADYKASLNKLTSMRLCSNTFAQSVIPAAMADNETPAAAVAPGGRLYEQSRVTVEALSKMDGVSVVKNKAAFYVFPKLDKEKFNIKSDKVFARDLLHATNILIVPGSGFDWMNNDHFRIVMLPEAEALAAAMEKIGNFLDTYKQQ